MRLPRSPLVARNNKGAFVIALSGDLGSGKTTFAQGFLRALGVRGPVTSPTFILMRRHALSTSPFPEGSTSKRGGIFSPPRIGEVRGGKPKAQRRFTSAYHVDAYRLKNSRALATLGFKKLLDDSKNIVVVEWADRIKQLLPKSAIWITFEHGRRGNERVVTKK